MAAEHKKVEPMEWLAYVEGSEDSTDDSGIEHDFRLLSGVFASGGDKRQPDDAGGVT